MTHREDIHGSYSYTGAQRPKLGRYSGKAAEDIFHGKKPSKPNNPPNILKRIVDKVLSYKPKPKDKASKNLDKSPSLNEKPEAKS